MEYKHLPPTLEELRASRKPIRKATRGEIKNLLTPPEQFAIGITHHVGSMGFFLVLIVWTLSWLVWNVCAPVEMRFDPAPAFVIWLFVSNMIQLILLPLIMVGQNLEGKYADKRAQADYEVNMKAEHEIEVIIAHLENQNEMLLELTRRIDRK